MREPGLRLLGALLNLLAILFFSMESQHVTLCQQGVFVKEILSPYLFILYAEGLSSLITHSINEGSLKGLVMCPGAPVIHHLLFADDSFIYGEATRLNVASSDIFLVPMNELPVKKSIC
jgi:hypothetical protein